MISYQVYLFFLLLLLLVGFSFTSSSTVNKSEIAKLEINFLYFCDDSIINQELDSTDNEVLSEREAPLRERRKEATSNM